MSIVEFSKCRIQFVPADGQHAKRDYSDRSLLELKQYDFGDYSLRALDIENNKEEIFNFPWREHGKYTYGSSIDQPDEVRSNNGTYRLWLHESSRNRFHKALRELKLREPSHSDSDPNSEDGSPMEDNVDDVFNAGDPTVASPKDMLHNVHRLSKYIEQGDSNGAAQLASQFASKGIRLRAKSSDRARNEEEFTISVQFDGNEYGIDQHGAQIPVEVYQSSTVRELRAAFELAYHFPPPSQYFFVNGCLAHDNSTMKELNVGPNSLFVLFLLTHTKTFKKTGPWVCSACKRTNQQNNFRCTTCSASRTE